MRVVQFLKRLQIFKKTTQAVEHGQRAEIKDSQEKHINGC